MSLLVLKFGGTSVGDVERIQNAAIKVASEVRLGHKVAVVVSAMANETNKLVQYCQDISTSPDPYEQDAVIAAGEQITAGLMALALQKLGLKARSWMGWQIPLLTDEAHGKARIQQVNAPLLHKHLDQGEVAVIAGFQGIDLDARITTLGRGGSDTSAVAIAVALNADRCDIYTDVDGVYTTDPRIEPGAQKITRITHEEMLELASNGSKVLHPRSVELAFRHNMPLQVLSTFKPGIGSDLPGTLLTTENNIVEQKSITGIAHSNNEAKITLLGVADRPGIAAAVIAPLADAHIIVDMIMQSGSAGYKTDITFTINKGDLSQTLSILEKHQAKIGYDKILAKSDVAKISAVGIGMRGHAGIAAKMFETLAANNISIQSIQTSEITIGVVIDQKYTDQAIRALHQSFGLSQRPETEPPTSTPSRSLS